MKNFKSHTLLYLLLASCLVVGISKGTQSIRSQPAGTFQAAVPVGTPITSLPFDIHQCGKYFVTGCLTGVAAQSGIEVHVDDVTIDLNGFTLTGVAGSLDGIELRSHVDNVTILNGSIQGWGRHGINAGTNTNRDVHVRDVRARENQNAGVVVGGDSIVSRVSALDNLGKGIVANDEACILVDCVVRGNGNIGIDVAVGSASVRGCVAQGNSLGIRAYDSSIVACVATDNTSDDGIYANSTCVVAECVTTGNATNGIRTRDSLIKCNASTGNGGQAIDVETASTVLNNHAP